MSQAKITLIGLENYLNPDQSLFDKMTLPEDIDKDTLIGSILMRCQEFELLYSDPYFMQDAISIWSRKNYRTFEKWVKALEIEYDPLYNYDRTEEYTDTHTGSKSGSGGNTRTDNLTRTDDLTRTDNLTQTNNQTQTNNLTETNNLSDTNDVTLTHSEKAYNDSNYVGTTQDVTDQDQSHTGTVTNTGSVTNTGTVGNSGTVKDTGTVKNTGTVTDQFNSADQDSYTNKHNARLFGNIGVTTSQQMLQSELDIARWNMYEHIADLFCQEFCVMVY